MDYDRARVYITSLDEPIPDELRAVRERCLEQEVPIIRDDMQMLMKFLMRERAPRTILEIGTGAGFSALLMVEYAPYATVTTIENYAPRIQAARANIEASTHAKRIRLVEGDAGEVLAAMPEDAAFDFVFMDAAKGQYPRLLPEVLLRLEQGGMLLTDNVLFDGDIIESRYLIKRRNRTIHKRMREYLHEITHRSDLTTVILPVGDGAAVSVRV